MCVISLSSLSSTVSDENTAINTCAYIVLWRNTIHLPWFETAKCSSTEKKIYQEDSCNIHKYCQIFIVSEWKVVDRLVNHFTSVWLPIVPLGWVSASREQHLLAFCPLCDGGGCWAGSGATQAATFVGHAGGRHPPQECPWPWPSRKEHWSRVVSSTPVSPLTSPSSWKLSLTCSLEITYSKVTTEQCYCCCRHCYFHHH